MKRLATFFLVLTIVFGTVPIWNGNPLAASTFNMNIHALYLTLNAGLKPENAEEPEMGDAVLVESNGHYLLMDTGNSYVSDSVITYLKALGVKQMDIYISHFHADHFMGMEAISKSGIIVDHLYLPATSVGNDYSSGNGGTQSNQFSKAKGFFPNAQVIELKKGSTFCFGSVNAEVLGPVSNNKQSKFKNDKWGEASGHYLNNQSLTTMLTCGSIKFLTTGDIESSEDQSNYSNMTLEEDALVKTYGKQLKADILKMPHHGLITSNSTAFIKAVTPTYSFAMNSGYDEPVISRDGKYKVSHAITPARRIQENGLVYLVSNEKKALNISVSNGNIILRKASVSNGKVQYSGTIAGSSYTGWVDLYGNAQIKNGSYTGKNHYYMKSGKFQKKIVKISGKWYNFGNGVTLEQGVYENGQYKGWRYMDEKKTKLAYFKIPDKDGRASAAIGFAKAKAPDGKTWGYYFDKKNMGARFEPKKSTRGAKGWKLQQIGQYKYLIKVNSGVVYNFGSKTNAYKSIGGKLLAFDKKGRMITGWATVSGRRYYFSKETGYRIKAACNSESNSDSNDSLKGVDKSDASNSKSASKGSDGTLVGKGASASNAEKAITTSKTDNDPAGSLYGMLQFASLKQTKASIKLKWKKIRTAKSYVLYGNECGKKNKMRKLKVLYKNSFNAKKINDKRLKKGTYYKFIIVALDKNNKVISTSKVIHVATKGSTFGNHKSITTNAKNNSLSIKEGNSFKLGAKAIPQNKRLQIKAHRAIKYESSNPQLVSVSKNGIIKAKKKGVSYVYAYAQNGVSARIKIAVK